MFFKTEGCTVEEIQGLPCNVPAVGYGINSITGLLEKTDVISSSPIAQGQKWTRTPLPKNWDKKRADEIKRQKTDLEYYDNELEKFRVQEWGRRLRGCWFYNNGNPTYLTGEHYMYLNWWCLDDGYPKFRDPDRKRYYYLQYCVEDPCCAGMVEASNRRSGKSYRGALFLYEYVSRSTDSIGGLQSKTGPDGKNLFKGKIVTPFKKLPDFFRPEIDAMSGSNPEKELKFTTTTRRGKAAMEDFSNLGLNSFINYLSSDQYAYDGWKLKRYLGDEVGKTAEVNVFDRWNTVKYCLRIGGKWIGKALLTTTVEKLKGEEAIKTPAFKKIWIASNHKEKNENGETASGLYKYFTPAYEMYDFDEYGFPLVGEGKLFYLNTRKALQSDPHALAAEISMNPFNEVEMFRDDGVKCLYNPELLNDQLDVLSWGGNYTTRGNFVWKDGKQDSQVVFEKDRNGRWEVCWLFPKSEDSNKIDKLGNKFKPLNSLKFVIGCDPFSHNVVKDDRRSDGAAVVLMKFGAFNDSGYNNAFVCKYKARPPSVTIFYEDMLKMAVYYGCKILFESNNPGWRQYFIQRGYEGFLMKLPDYPDYGIPANEKTKQHLAEVTEDYILKNSKNVWFADLITDWLEFDLQKSTKYDLAMAAGWAIVADTEMNFRQVKETSHKLTDFFHRYKNTA